jgi:hypothetical protein
MKFVIPVRPEDLGKFERNMQRNLKLEINRQLRAAESEVESELRLRSQHIRDQGAFQSSWRARAQFASLVVWNFAVHALFVEGSAETDPYARRPGTRMPPLQVIREWLLRRGSDPRLAFVVARAIAARGILARPVLRSRTVQLAISNIVTRRMSKAWDEAAMRSR